MPLLVKHAVTVSHLVAQLPDDDAASLDRLATVHLDSAALGDGISAVLGRSCTLFVRSLDRQGLRSNAGQTDGRADQSCVCKRGAAAKLHAGKRRGQRGCGHGTGWLCGGILGELLQKLLHSN